MIRSRAPWLGLAGLLLLALLAAASVAPAFLSTPEPGRAFLSPFAAPPLGTDDRGIGLHEVALQGAAIVTLPAVGSAALVAALATAAGLVRCLGWSW
ncbi:MAG: hypothetical protein ABMB14_11210, partial [Myxococcota bacterium]